MLPVAGLPLGATSHLCCGHSSGNGQGRLMQAGFLLSPNVIDRLLLPAPCPQHVVCCRLSSGACLQQCRRMASRLAGQTAIKLHQRQQQQQDSVSRCRSGLTGLSGLLGRAGVWTTWGMLCLTRLMSCSSVQRIVTTWYFQLWLPAGQSCGRCIPAAGGSGLICRHSNSSRVCRLAVSMHSLFTWL